MIDDKGYVMIKETLRENHLRGKLRRNVMTMLESLNESVKETGEKAVETEIKSLIFCERINLEQNDD